MVHLSNVCSYFAGIAILMRTYFCFADSNAGTTADSLILILDKMYVTAKRGDVLQSVTGEQSRIVDPAQMSVVKSINLVPSLSQQSVDPLGIADISNYHELRERQ